MGIPFKGQYSDEGALAAAGKPGESIAWAYTVNPPASSLWVWGSASIAPVDGTNTFGFNANPGRWSRDPSVIQQILGTIPFVLSATTFFVDPQNTSGAASDNNNGTSAQTPFATVARVTSAIGGETPDLGVGATVTINLLSDTNQSDPIKIAPTTGLLVVVGASVQQITGTISAVTQRNQATAQEWNVATASFPSWTPYLGMLLHDTTIANGGFFFIKADLTGGNAKVTQPMASGLSTSSDPSPAYVTPAAPDAFEVLRLSTVHVEFTGSTYPPSAVLFQRCNLQSATGASGQITCNGSTSFQECTFSAYVISFGAISGDINNQITRGRPAFINCYLLKGGEIANGPVMLGGCVVAPWIIAPSPINSILDGGIVFEGSANPQGFPGPGRQGFGDVGLFGTNINFGGAGQARQVQATMSIGTSTNGYTSTAKLWGTSALPCKSGTIFSSKNGFPTDIASSGTLTLAGQTTGVAIDESTSPPTITQYAGTPITTAGIDAQPGHGIVSIRQFCGFIKEA